jgi:hypothetical protein
VIVVRTKTGFAWTVMTLDRLAVTPAGTALPGTMAGLAFTVGEIAEVIVDARGGAVALLDGQSPRDGAELRAIQVTDAETDVPVRVLFPLEQAQELGERLHEGKLWTPPSLGR